MMDRSNDGSIGMHWPEILLTCHAHLHA